MDEARMDVIAQNGNDGEHYEWIKHDGTRVCPVSPDTIVEIITYSKSVPNERQYQAARIAWSFVNLYKVVKQ